MISPDSIPFEKFSNLCSWIFCFVFLKTELCQNCNKKYCNAHAENHICYTDHTQKIPVLNGNHRFEEKVFV